MGGAGTGLWMEKTAQLSPAPPATQATPQGVGDAWGPGQGEVLRISPLGGSCGGDRRTHLPGI